MPLQSTGQDIVWYTITILVLIIMCSHHVPDYIFTCVQSSPAGLLGRFAPSGFALTFSVTLLPRALRSHSWSLCSLGLRSLRSHSRLLRSLTLRALHSHSQLLLACFIQVRFVLRTHKNFQKKSVSQST